MRIDNERKNWKADKGKAKYSITELEKFLKRKREEVEEEKKIKEIFKRSKKAIRSPKWEKKGDEGENEGRVKRN